MLSVGIGTSKEIRLKRHKYELQVHNGHDYETAEKADDLPSIFRAIHRIHAEEEDLNAYDFREVPSRAIAYRDVSMADFTWRVDNGIAYSKLRKYCSIISTQGPITLEEVQTCASGFEMFTIRLFG